MGFVAQTSRDIYQSSNDLIATGIVILLILVIILVAKKGFGGLGFWGRKRKKVAEFKFNHGKWTTRLFVYQLWNKSGYKGYGLEFAHSRLRSYAGHAGMKASASAMEFTKDEADQLVDLIRPHL